MITLPASNVLSYEQQVAVLNKALETLQFFSPLLNPKVGQAVPGANYLRAGLIAYADGTNWDPAGDGTEGYFWYDGSAWQRFAPSAVGLSAGMCMDWPTETVPDGWLERNGASLLIADYADLYAVIGKMHGSADAEHFNLMDDRGRFPRWWAHGQATDPDRATRTAPGATGATISAGDHVGTEETDDYKQHYHTTLSGSASGTLNGTGAALAGGYAGNTSNMPATGGNETRPINRAYMPIIKY